MDVKIKQIIAEIQDVFEVDIPDDNQLINETWENNGRVHNWRNYIWDSDKKIWTEQSQTWRAMQYAKAETLAGAEEWD